ncbi:MAG: hypothetical protein JWN69_364 [Alphaproteobacteria bacterium]|nr:hypothetical protein [Alphaproteobacteria bacterium]
MTAYAERRAFWEHPALLAAIVLAACIPLLFPAIPPLVDVPGHMSRYHVELAIGDSPYLSRYYGFQWALIGNLGIDLLIIPVAKIFGLELGTKLIVMAIPMLMSLGFLAVAREVHGRIPPTAFFALPLAYSYPFQFGFVNFSLSAALCFLAFALWLRLGRTGRGRLRALIFVPLASLLWLCHTYGWGLLGILAFSAEAAARREAGASWLRASWRAVLASVPLMLPFALMLLWRSGLTGGDTFEWFNWTNKIVWMASLLREHWQAWDVAGAALLIMLCALGLLGIDFRMVLPLKLAAILMLPLFLVIPFVLLSSGYADMRLAPIMVAVGVLALDLKDPSRERFAATVAAAGLVFFIARLAVTTQVFAAVERDWQHQLTALDHIAPGSRVLALANTPCPGAATWATRRMDHLDTMAVIRRDAFTNGMWAVRGAQLLQVNYKQSRPFVTDPSQMLRPPRCRGRYLSIEQALATPAGSFDYLWLIDVPREQWPHKPGLVAVWQGGETGILYRAPGASNPPINAAPATTHQPRRTPTGD